MRDWRFTNKASHAIWMVVVAALHALFHLVSFHFEGGSVWLAVAFSLGVVVWCLLLWAILNHKCWQGEPWIQRVRSEEEGD